MFVQNTPSATKRIPIFVCIAGICAAAIILGCGNKMSPAVATNPSPSPTAQTLMQVRMGDSPADRVVSFEVTVGPIVLAAADGTMVNLLSAPQRLEMTHLSGTNQVLSILRVPQGSYTSAAITIADPEIVFIDSAGQTQRLEPAFNQTITVPLNPALDVSSSPDVLAIDFNVAQSLTFDAQGNITGASLSPSSFTLGLAPVAPKDRQDDDDGQIDGITGLITAVNGTSFTLAVDNTGFVLTFTTDANTRFDDGVSLAVNTIVTVQGSTLPDGTLYASEIEAVENQQGAEAQGLVTRVTGDPATQITFIANQGMGSGMDDSQIGSTVTADVRNAQYRIHQQDVDSSGLGGLPSARFPFDATTIHAGQRVEVDNDGGMDNDHGGGNGGGDGGDNGGDGGGQGNNNDNHSARRVELQEQTLFGSVSGLPGATPSGPATFTLTVPSDSIFATLSGQTTIYVLWQRGTNLHDLSGVSNGDTIRVRGLLFFNGARFTMIAAQLTR